jgi:hypothetical protein
LRVRLAARLVVWGTIIAGGTMRRGRPPDYSGSRSQRFFNFLRKTRVRRPARLQPWGRRGRRRLRSSPERPLLTPSVLLFATGEERCDPRHAAHRPHIAYHCK